jgi:ketosteroid isomerase-like protein
MSFMMNPPIGFVKMPGVVNKNESVVTNMIAQNVLPIAETNGLFFKCADRPATFNFTDVNVTAGGDVAFATAVGHCTTVNDGRRESLEFRLTMGLRKIDGRWTIVHEHHSVPSE